MSQSYKIKAVKAEPKEWPSQYGPMLTYTVLFEDRETPVEINKKPDSPAPKVGDIVEGDINRTEYGDKFKAAPKAFGGGGGGAKSFSKPQDQYTMFLSYAKDVAVAMLDKTGKLDEAAYGVVLAAVNDGGKTLYEARPDGSVDVKKEEPAEDPFKKLDAAFGEEESLWNSPQS